MDVLCSNFIFAAFYKFEIISKEKCKKIYPKPRKQTKAKQQKHLVTEVRQMKKAKRSLREDRGSQSWGW